MLTEISEDEGHVFVNSLEPEDFDNHSELMLAFKRADIQLGNGSIVSKPGLVVHAYFRDLLPFPLTNSRRKFKCHELN